MSLVPEETFEECRRLAPFIGRQVLCDGKPCLLWGVTPHGAIIDPSIPDEPARAVLTMAHRRVTAGESK